MSLLDCYGQLRPLRQLELARLHDRVAHSLLFVGPDGVGKSMLARQWAKLQLCHHPVPRPLPDDYPALNAPFSLHDACGTCHDCHLVDTGGHPDLHIVNRQIASSASEKRKTQMLQLPIDVIREFVIEPSAMQPARQKARVFIIEEAETMNRAAQNALLKTLEEPPPATFIILICSQPDALLPTVRSRCQLVNFAPLPIPFVREKLQSQGVPDDEAAYWADFCGGQLGLASELASMGWYARRDQLTGHLAQLSYKTLLDVAQWFVDESARVADELTKARPELTKASATRHCQQQLLQMAAHIFQWLMRITTNTQVPQAAQADPALAAMAQRLIPISCCDAIHAACRAEYYLQANVNATLIFESLMIDWLECFQQTR